MSDTQDQVSYGSKIFQRLVKAIGARIPMRYTADWCKIHRDWRLENENIFDDKFYIIVCFFRKQLEYEREQLKGNFSFDKTVSRIFYLHISFPLNAEILTLLRIRDRLRLHENEEVSETEQVTICDHMLHDAYRKCHEVIELVDSVGDKTDSAYWDNDLGLVGYLGLPSSVIKGQATTYPERAQIFNKYESVIQEVADELKRLESLTIVKKFLIGDKNRVFGLQFLDCRGTQIPVIRPLLSNGTKKDIATTLQVNPPGHEDWIIFEDVQFYWMDLNMRRIEDWMNSQTSIISDDDDDSRKFERSGSIKSDEIDKWHKNGLNDNDLFEPNHPDNPSTNRGGDYPVTEDEYGLDRPVKGDQEDDQHFNIRNDSYQKLRSKVIAALKDKGKGKAKEDSSSASRKKPDDSDLLNDRPTSQEGLDDSKLEHLLGLDEVKDAIRSYREDPDKHKSWNHLRRFGDAQGRMQELVRDKIEDDDCVISYFCGQYSVRFILTFGGQDYRPVFNRVIFQRWDRWC